MPEIGVPASPETGRAARFDTGTETGGFDGPATGGLPEQKAGYSGSPEIGVPATPEIDQSGQQSDTGDLDPRGTDTSATADTDPQDRVGIDDLAPPGTDGSSRSEADGPDRVEQHSPDPAESGEADARNRFSDSDSDRSAGDSDDGRIRTADFAAALERAGAFADHSRRPADTAPEPRELAVATVLDRYGVRTPEGRAAVERVHDVITEHLAPLITYGTMKILDAARAAVAEHPDTRVVFLGRDGHSLALAANELDPEFFRRHCTEVTVSRVLADASLQDLEQHSGREFPEVEAFRSARDKVEVDDIPGSRAQLTNYLEGRGVPVADPGSRILLIDTSFNGTVQELLSAEYPDVHFEGHYLFHAESPDDPHPGTKTGHLLHISADGSRPADVFASTFSHKDAVLAVEHMLRGPLSKAVRFDADGLPEQRPEAPITGLDHRALAPEYRDEAVRRAALDIAQVAVAQHAERFADRVSGPPRPPGLPSAAARTAEQVRSWREGRDTVDPTLRTVLDSFVRRSDRPPAG
ncbi:hypothetical protein [Nocardia sp. BMG111209]|uniref:hypothetical protein n=1 Tax=Nocardia sp. BMG111209 TaxID=1160137 RepID=UPI0012DC00AC|nr:hypothetical protein [Nocardia sp. BMG111209]